MALKFFGNLEPNHLPKTNQIWAFTLGELTAKGWDSDKQPNLQMLVLKVEAEEKKQSPGLTIAIPRFNGNAANGFDFGEKGTGHDKFRLFIHETDLVTPLTILVFHNLKVKDKKLHFFNHRSTIAASHTLLTFSIDPDIEVIGARG